MKVLDIPAGVFYIYPLKHLLVDIGNDSLSARVGHLYVYEPLIPAIPLSFGCSLGLNGLIVYPEDVWH